MLISVNRDGTGMSEKGGWDEWGPDSGKMVNEVKNEGWN